MHHNQQLDPDLQGRLELCLDLQERHLFWLQRQRHILREESDRGEACLLARAIDQMSVERLAGPEREFFQETARQAGRIGKTSIQAFNNLLLRAPAPCP